MRLTRSIAAEEWSVSLGEERSCDLSRNGRSHPAAKSHEGRVAALGELLRVIADDVGPVTLACQAAGVKARWVAQARTRARRDADWEAYHASGIRAMDEVVAACDGY